MKLPAPRSRWLIAFLACALVSGTIPSDASAQRRRGVDPAATVEQGTDTRDYVEAIAPMVFCVAWPDAVYEGLRWQGMQPGPSGSVVSAVLLGRAGDGAATSVTVSLVVQGAVLRSIEWREHSGGGSPPGTSTGASSVVDEINAAYQTHRPTGGTLPPPFSGRCAR